MLCFCLFSQPECLWVRRAILRRIVGTLRTCVFPAVSSCVRIRQALPKPQHSIIHTRSPLCRHLLTFSTNLFSTSFLFSFCSVSRMYSVGKQGRGPSIRQYQKAQVEWWWGEYKHKVPFVNLVKCTQYIYAPWYKQFT